MSSATNSAWHFKALLSSVSIMFVVTNSWRGHVKSVTSLTLVEEHKILLSSSVDCTVRMWNLEGHYIGNQMCDYSKCPKISNTLFHILFFLKICFLCSFFL